MFNDIIYCNLFYILYEGVKTRCLYSRTSWEVLRYDYKFPAMDVPIWEGYKVKISNQKTEPECRFSRKKYYKSESAWYVKKIFIV